MFPVLLKPVIMFVQLLLNFPFANESGIQLLLGKLAVPFDLVFLFFELHYFKLAVSDEFR